MNSGFLLKFQEDTKPAIEKCITKLHISAEQDKPSDGFIMPLAATRTFTEVRPEADDRDPHSESLKVFPR